MSIDLAVSSPLVVNWVKSDSFYNDPKILDNILSARRV